MAAAKPSGVPRTVAVARVIQIGLLADAAAIVCTVLRSIRPPQYPRLLPGLCAAGAVLASYAVFSTLLARKAEGLSAVVARRGLLLGLFLGGMFAFQILVEYFINVTARVDGILGWLAFGSLPPIFFVCGVVSARSSGRLSTGNWIAVLAMMIASVLWYALLLFAYSAAMGSAREMKVLDATGTLGDFQRSGEKDLRLFIMTDWLGAGFFHLLLGPAMSAVCATFGGVVGLI